MRQSLKGHHLPESFKEFQELVTLGANKFSTCFMCKQPFSLANTKSGPGWAETQISATCEACFDKLFKEDEENV